LERIHKIHDLGFLFYPSFCIGYGITKDNYLKSAALTAADSLLSRFNDKNSAITVSGDPKESGLTAIDTMMNLPLLWWAYERTHDIRYYNAAYKHSITAMQYFIREDGSTYHVVKFDTKSGSVIQKPALQGYNSESCWSRGQAWAIYGFTLAYRYTKDELFLKTAKNLAGYFIKNLSFKKKALPKKNRIKNLLEDYVPY
jgi:unsaturated chondroitin disaccharide hydrolase